MHLKTQTFLLKLKLLFQYFIVSNKSDAIITTHAEHSVVPQITDDP